MLDDVDAVVLVGGKGTRLRPLTLSAPKPMLPTAGVPFLAHLLSPHPGGRRRAGSCSAPPTWPRRSPSTSATAPRSGWSSSTSSRTSRWAPAAASATSPTGSRADDVLVFNGDVLSGVDLAELRRHAPRTAPPTSPCTWSGSPTRARSAACRPTPTAGCRRSWRRPTTRRPTRSTPAATSSAASVIDSIPTGPAGLGRAGDVPRAAAPRARGCSGTSTSPTGWTSARRPTFVRGSADLVRGDRADRGAARPDRARRWCSTAREVAADALLSGGTTVGAGVHGRRRRPGGRARCCSTAPGRARAPSSTRRWSVRGARDRARARGARTRWSATARSSARTASCGAGIRVWPDIVLPPHGGAVLPGRLTAVSGTSADTPSDDRDRLAEWRAGRPRRRPRDALAAASAAGATRRSHAPPAGRSGAPAPTPDGPATTRRLSAAADGTVVHAGVGPGRGVVARRPARPARRATTAGRVRRPPPAGRRRAPAAWPACGSARTRRVWDRLFPAVLEQKVTGTEARRSWRELCAATATPRPARRPTACACRRRPPRSARCPTGSGTGRASTTPGGGRSWPRRPSRTGWSGPSSWAATRGPRAAAARARHRRVDRGRGGPARAGATPTP